MNSFILQIGTDFLEESITAFEDIVQSVDIAAFIEYRESDTFYIH